jgi:pantoate--beta-alanine ligase
MIICETVESLRKHISAHKSGGKSIGFVPTMGALHEGHISLIRMAGRENDIVVCSIFVNPTQFNDPKDLDKYPRTMEKDAIMLKNAGNHLLFFPSNKEVYPPGLDTKLAVSLNGLDELMEGKFRPGHFEGVAQVVKRLLDIVQPDRLYMGQKDFQQFTIIQHLINTLDLPVILRVAKIKREAHGLAMSSRNVRLSKKARAKANIIYKTLLASKRRLKKESLEEVQRYALNRLNKADGFEPEYFEFIDGNTLKPAKSLAETPYLVACTAVWTEGVRLIDNMIMQKPEA